MANAPDRQYTGSGFMEGDQNSIMNDPNIQVKLQEVLLSQLAEQDQKTARARIEATNTEVGTVQPTNLAQSDYVVKPGERVVATFGRTQVVSSPDEGIDIIHTPAIKAQLSRPLDTARVTDAVVKGKKSFDIDAEFAKLKTLTDPTEREDAAQLLFMNLGAEASAEQNRIRTIAAQRAGVNDAQASLDKNIALDAAAMATGRIRQGDTTLQTTNARATYQAALQAANQLETDMLKSSPMIQKLTDYRALLNREFGQIDKSQAKREARDMSLPVLTDERLQNAKFALGIQETNATKLKDNVANSLLKDKALQTVIDATKQDFPMLLVHPDAKVRQYAFNMIAGYERSNLGLGPKDELPGYIKALEPLVANREAMLKEEDKKALLKPTSEVSRAVGEKAKGEARSAFLYNKLVAEIESTAKNKYQRMDLWSFTNPDMKAIVDGVRTTTKDSKVLMSDGIQAIMKADLKNPDGSVMTPQQKISNLVQSLSVSMGNDQGSAILPSVQNYEAEMAANVRNQAMKAYVRNQWAIHPLISSDTFAELVLGAQSTGEDIGKAFRNHMGLLVDKSKQLIGGK